MFISSHSKKFLIALATAGLTAGCVASAGAQSKTNADVMARYFQLVDGKQPGTLAEVEAPGVSYELPLGKMDSARHAQVLQSFAVAFPNYKHTITRCVEAGDLVSCEGTFSADHTGPLAMPDGSTLPPTQKHVEFPIAEFARVQNGKFIEYDGYFDVLGFLAQLGVGPGAPKAQ